MPGETYVMADLKGPGVVSHIWLTAADNEFAWPRSVRLRVYYDGKKNPEYRRPLGDFFGVDTDTIGTSNPTSSGTAHSVVRGTVGRCPSVRHARSPLPTKAPVPSRCSTITSIGNSTSRCRTTSIIFTRTIARNTRPSTAKITSSSILTALGTTSDTVLNVVQAQVGWFGEGDDLFYVDGSEHPQIVGTGTEDYVNEAWGLRVSCGPWAGTPVAEGELVGARLTGYRWHIPDPIPFTKSLWAGIEHAGWTYNPDGSLRSGFEERPDYLSSVAFWYQKDVNEGLPEPPYGEARLPIGHAEQIAVEDSLSEVKTSKGRASVQREVDWGRDLLFFEAEGKGARIDIPIDVPASGRYEIVARIAQAPDYGDYIALLDDKPTMSTTGRRRRRKSPHQVRKSFTITFPRYTLRSKRRWGGSI